MRYIEIEDYYGNTKEIIDLKEEHNVADEELNTRTGEITLRVQAVKYPANKEG